MVVLVSKMYAISSPSFKIHVLEVLVTLPFNSKFQVCCEFFPDCCENAYQSIYYLDDHERNLWPADGLHIDRTKHFRTLFLKHGL